MRGRRMRGGDKEREENAEEVMDQRLKNNKPKYR